MLTKLFGEISRLRAASPFHSVRLSPRSARNDGRGCEIRELAEIFVSEILANWQNRVFAPAPAICKYFCFCRKGECGAHSMVCPERARRRGKLRLYRAKRGQWGCPQTHEIFFCQLKRKFVNYFVSNASTALLMCRRFSAWSYTMDCGPSMTSAETSSPRCAGMQCMNTASSFASAIVSLVTR